MTFTIEEFESLRSKRWFRATNKDWNASGINSPKNFGYIMPMIAKCNPNTLSDWSTYFEKEVATDDQIREYADIFKKVVLADKGIQHIRRYDRLTDEDWCKMVVCRLMYETSIGYFAEKAISEQLPQVVKDITLKPLTPEDDNKYAVDRFLYDKNGKLICGVQIKSVNYGNMASPIMRSTVYMNERKNELFNEEYGVPVVYVRYERDAEKYFITENDEGVEKIKKLLN